MKSPAKSCLLAEQGLTPLSACSGGTSASTPCPGHHQWKCRSSLCPSSSSHTSQLFLEELPYSRGASLVAQTGKNLHPKQEMRVQSLGQEDPLEKGLATHSSILAWEIPRNLVGYSPWGHKESRHDWSNLSGTIAGLCHRMCCCCSESAECFKTFCVDSLHWIIYREREKTPHSFLNCTL